MRRSGFLFASAFVILALIDLGPSAIVSRARGDAKADIDAAVKDLADAKSYSWTVTLAGQAMSAPGDGGAQPLVIWHIGGIIECQTDADGVTSLFSHDNKERAFIRDGNTAIKTFWGWKPGSQFIEEHEKDLGYHSTHLGTAIIARDLQAPTAQLQKLTAQVRDLKQVDDHFEAALMDEASEQPVTLLAEIGVAQSFPAERHNRSTQSVSVWIDKGQLSRIEFYVSGIKDGQEVWGTVTYEFKDIGKTVFDIPNGARRILKMPDK
jgi:hypothetical protein